MPRLSPLRRRQRDDIMFDDLRLSADETRVDVQVGADQGNRSLNAGCGGRKRAIVCRGDMAIPRGSTSGDDGAAPRFGWLLRQDAVDGGGVEQDPVPVLLSVIAHSSVAPPTASSAVAGAAPA